MDYIVRTFTTIVSVYSPVVIGYIAYVEAIMYIEENNLFFRRMAAKLDDVFKGHKLHSSGLPA